jgi:hypothetical protein
MIMKLHANRADRRKTYRKAWLSAQKGQPKIILSELASRMRRIYSWLYSFDQEWLNSHKPAPSKGAGRTLRADWKSRDTRFAVNVRQEALRLRNMPGAPVRVTANLIARNLNEVEILNKRDFIKLPKTVRVLKEVIDTQITFATRRLHWADGYFRQENISPTRTALRERAGLHSSVWSGPQMRVAFEATWLDLQGGDEACALEAA